MAVLPLTVTAGIQEATLPAGIGERVFGTYVFDRTARLALFQQQVLPAAGVTLLLAAAALFFARRHAGDTVVWLIGLGSGAVGFSYFRLFLVHTFAPRPILGLFWEEVLELAFLLAFTIWWLTSGSASVQPPGEVGPESAQP